MDSSSSCGPHPNCRGRRSPRRRRRRPRSRRRRPAYGTACRLLGCPAPAQRCATGPERKTGRAGQAGAWAPRWAVRSTGSKAARGPVEPADLGARAALAQDHVGGVVGAALEQGGADGVGVDRDPGGLEGGDPLGGEAAETITRTWPNPWSSRALRTFSTRRRLTPVGTKSPISDHSARSTIVLGVQPHPQPLPVLPGAGQGGRHRVVVEVDQGDQGDGGELAGEGAHRGHGVTAEGGDQGVGDGAEAALAHQAAWASVATPGRRRRSRQPSPPWVAQWSKRSAKNSTGLPRPRPPPGGRCSRPGPAGQDAPGRRSPGGPPGGRGR